MTKRFWVSEGLFVSGLIGFGIGVVSDLYEAEQNREYLNVVWNAEKAGDMASDYDCNGNIVLYDNGTVDVCLYEGEYTEEKAEAVGEWMGNENFDVDYIVNDTSNAFNDVCNYLETYGDEGYSDALKLK